MYDKVICLAPEWAKPRFVTNLWAPQEPEKIGGTVMERAHDSFLKKQDQLKDMGIYCFAERLLDKELNKAVIRETKPFQIAFMTVFCVILCVATFSLVAAMGAETVVSGMLYVFMAFVAMAVLYGVDKKLQDMSPVNFHYTHLTPPSWELRDADKCALPYEAQNILQKVRQVYPNARAFVWSHPRFRTLHDYLEIQVDGQEFFVFHWLTTAKYHARGYGIGFGHETEVYSESARAA